MIHQILYCDVNLFPMTWQRFVNYLQAMRDSAYDRRQFVCTSTEAALVLE